MEGDTPLVLLIADTRERQLSAKSGRIIWPTEG